MCIYKNRLCPNLQYQLVSRFLCQRIIQYKYDIAKYAKEATTHFPILLPACLDWSEEGTSGVLEMVVSYPSWRTSLTMTPGRIKLMQFVLNDDGNLFSRYKEIYASRLTTSP